MIGREGGALFVEPLQQVERRIPPRLAIEGENAGGAPEAALDLPQALGRLGTVLEMAHCFAQALNQGIETLVPLGLVKKSALDADLDAMRGAARCLQA